MSNSLFEYMGFDKVREYRDKLRNELDTVNNFISMHGVYCDKCGDFVDLDNCTRSEEEIEMDYFLDRIGENGLVRGNRNDKFNVRVFICPKGHKKYTMINADGSLGQTIDEGDKFAIALLD